MDGRCFEAALHKDHRTIITPDQVQTLMSNICIAQLNMISTQYLKSQHNQRVFNKCFVALNLQCWIQIHTSALHSSWTMQTQLLIFTWKMGKTISKLVQIF